MTKPKPKPDYEVIDHAEFGLILAANNGASLRNARSGGRLPTSLRYLPLPALPHPVVDITVEDVTVTLRLADSSWHRVVVR